MIIIFTLDEQNGTRCMSRRQTRDRAVADYIMRLAGKNLKMKPDTMSFWKNNNVKPNANSVIQSLKKLPPRAVFFAEEPVPKAIMQAAQKIYVFRWNRKYPSMSKDRVCLQGYNRTVLDEFQGHSHFITLEVYTK